jgi:hypothetical protein
MMMVVMVMMEMMMMVMMMVMMMAMMAIICGESGCLHNIDEITTKCTLWFGKFWQNVT